MKRSLFRCFGGKYTMAKSIIALLPPHRVYTEPFGGAASVLMRKPPSPVEVLGDADLDIVSLYRCVQDPTLCAMLVMKMTWTPFSSAEFERACTETGGLPLERAWRVIVRSAMAFSPERVYAKISGFRRSTGSATLPASYDWSTYADALPAFRDRLRRVIIEHGDAISTMRHHDHPDTLHYVDPPYVPATRTSRHGYVHELDDDGQARLLECLRQLKGMVILSGYDSALYSDGLPGWSLIRRNVRDSARRERTECLWLNPSAALAGESQTPLFAA
ncbi:DNA adenine methylase [Bosea robiniae]|uniref:DNA adenine methylase n=1 Tax=Bosea robiniae TaxID=1036780 RepID=A0ABY0P7X4_9HYPH|nr:DNA adenine methylase [Bosea robiniae]SDH20141.1 DNA adenine methylase [Bosea robiniae]